MYVVHCMKSCTHVAMDVHDGHFLTISWLWTDKTELCPKGCLESVDWTTGLEYWNGLAAKSLLESSYSLSHFTNLLHALFRRPALKSWGSKVTAY